MTLRADAASTSSSASPTKTSDAVSKTTKSDSKSDAKSASGTAASKTAKASGTAAATSGGAAASASGTQKAAATTQSVNPVLPPGGANMLTPSALAQSTYYKIGDFVSFAWNYTSLSIPPSRVDVLVSCTANSATYTLKSNASFEKTGSVVWDTSPDITGTAPLLTETYTLVIYDAQKAITDVAPAGKLGVTNDYRFGMYIPQKYTPLSSKSFPKPTCTRRSTDFMLVRLDLCGMQRCALGYGAAGSEIHVGHVHCHCTVFYVVC